MTTWCIYDSEFYNFTVVVNTAHIDTTTDIDTKNPDGHF